MTTENSTNGFIACLKGAVPLYKAFWYYAIPVQLVFYVSGIVVGYLAGSYPGLSQLIFVVGPLYFLFFLWFCVSMWRCAFNVKKRFWGYLVRGWVLLLAIGALLQILRLLS